MILNFFFFLEKLWKSREVNREEWVCLVFWEWNVLGDQNEAEHSLEDSNDRTSSPLCRLLAEPQINWRSKWHTGSRIGIEPFKDHSLWEAQMVLILRKVTDTNTGGKKKTQWSFKCNEDHFYIGFNTNHSSSATVFSPLCLLVVWHTACFSSCVCWGGFRRIGYTRTQTQQQLQDFTFCTDSGCVWSTIICR